MALTAQDLSNIKHLFDDRFERIDQQFTEVRHDIDCLARATAQQFAVVDERFAAIDARLDAMDARFDTMDTRLDAMDARFDTIDARFEAVDDQLTSFSDRFDHVDEELADIKAVVGSHEFRLTRLERHSVTGS